MTKSVINNIDIFKALEVVVVVDPVVVADFCNKFKKKILNNNNKKNNWKFLLVDDKQPVVPFVNPVLQA